LHLLLLYYPPTQLRAQRLEQFYAVVKDEKNLDQTFESLKPYIQPDIGRLAKFTLESFDEGTWQTILADVPANMATGGMSGPSRFNKAIAVIEQHLSSMKAAKTSR
jgi:CHASE3 domain sensor protein